jgi:uncharacterized protein YndB with AHSA1/START domain
MRYETSLTTTAEPARLWAVVSAVEHWPEWIEVYEDVSRAGSGDLECGDTVHVKQKGLAGGDWTVTELDEGRVFTWASQQPGVRIVGKHTVTAEPGGSRLTLELEMTGWASSLVGLLMGRKSRAYVDLECERLTAVAAEPTAA